MKNIISICIISENNENTIKKCLESLKTVNNKEVLLFDLGSVDKTIKIAKKYAKIIKMKKEHDLARLKNKFFKYTEAEWLLFMEPEEALTPETAKNLNSFLESRASDKRPVIYNLKVYNLQPEGYPVTSFYSPVLFRNGAGIKFRSKIFPYPVLEKGVAINEKLPFLSMYNYTGLQQSFEIQKAAHNKVNTLIELINQDSLNYYYHYQLANCFCQIFEFYKAVDAYKNALELYKKEKFYEEQIHAEILIKLAGTQAFCTKNYQDALKNLDLLLKLSEKFPDALYLKAYCLQQEGNFSEAIAIYESTLNLLGNNISEINPLGISSLEASIQPMLKAQLGRCLLISGAGGKGYAYLIESYQESPANYQTHLYLILNFLLEENLEHAFYYYFKNTNQTYTKKEVESLRQVAKMPKNTLTFRIQLLKFLKSLEELEELLPVEKKAVKDKIAGFGQNIL